MGEDCSKRGKIILKVKFISLSEYYPKISIRVKIILCVKIIFMMMIIL